jgi:hypothetical protein
MLGVTCNNATNNDTMVEKLANLIEEFPGAPNRTRCFTHIVNLVAKTVIQQFDLQKKSGSEVDHLEAEKELQDLAAGVDLEELQSLGEDEGESNDC